MAGVVPPWIVASGDVTWITKMRFVPYGERTIGVAAGTHVHVAPVVGAY